MEERFEVLSGHPSFLAGRKWQTARPGDAVVFRRHAARLSIAATRWPTWPAMLAAQSSLQHFLEAVAALARAGKLTRHGLPETPSASLQAAAMIQQQKETRARALTR